MKLGIVGNGVVGSALARSYLEHADVLVYDVVPERRTHSLEMVLGCDLIFICLPTPQKEGSLECDTSAIDEFFEHVGKNTLGEIPEGGWLARNFVLRSTVPVGYTQRLKNSGVRNILHSPEFLTARCSFTDAQIPSRNIVGIPRGGCNTLMAALCDLYRRRFPGVPVHAMRSDESELVKLAQNGFFAAKVVYFSAVKLMCDALGLEWEDVRAGILADGRIAHAHTMVPGPSGKIGAGGACLPGDYKVVTSDGKFMSLENLFNIVNSGKKQIIRSANICCSMLENKLVTRVHRRLFEGELLSLNIGENIELRCTPDHLLPIIRDGSLILVTASRVRNDDYLLRCHL